MPTPKAPVPVEVTREVPVTVEVTREVPVTVEVIREVEVPKEVEVIHTVEVPVTVVATREAAATAIPAIPYPTPTPYLLPYGPGVVVYLWIEENVYVNDKKTSALSASAQANTDIDSDELKVVVTRHGTGRTLTFINCDSTLYNDEITELPCHLGSPVVSEEALEVIAGVRAQMYGERMPCERHQNSTMEESVYTCELQP